MLSELESWLAAVLGRGLPANTAVSAGPVAAAATAAGVNVCAGGLALLPVAAVEEAQARSREPAFAQSTVRFNGDGQTTRFALAGDELAEVRLAAEAGAPVGRLARLGDQCWHENGQLSFLRAPQAPVAAVLRGVPAAGYRQAVPASLALGFTFQGPRPAEVDGWCAAALAAVLWAFAESDYVELAEVAALGFSLRLLHPRAELQTITRDAAGPDDARQARTRMTLGLSGELEFNLALGTAEAPQLIRRILGTLQARRESKEEFGVPDGE
ncbi:hypothetical protein [uncultured Azohydromonas sp.]|jgi:hypothetical protein|uniref:hypothetical protein n=1 Tax=uncultured Azohydromonas sp. TaxID=487342 RepID=UPI00260B8DB7|nr:hypothetical protein [uncultured Azohydromonas sp.]